MDLKRKANDTCYDLGRLCKLVHLSNSHASLAPEESSIPTKIRVFNWVLIWILHYSSDEQIIEMVTDIKLAIMNVLIGLSQVQMFWQ